MNVGEDPSDEGTQFFREERVEGAIYNVYLKKVHYHSVPEEAILESNKALLAWRTHRVRVIKAGSLEKLVDSFTMESGELDSTYVNIFLTTYRSFSSPRAVLDLVLDRYRVVSEDKEMKQELKERTKRNLRTVISVWLDTYPDDFRVGPDYPGLRLIQIFALKYMPDSDLGNRAKQKADRFRKEEELYNHGDTYSLSGGNEYCFNEVAFMLDMPSKRPLDFRSIPNHQFAEQLTWKDSELFKKVVPHHCLGSVWSRRDKKKGEDAPSITATIKQFNAVSHRVIASVLKSPGISNSQRSKILEKWIDIAQELRVVKNFSSLKAIISGLQSHAVYRLQRVWEHVSKDSHEVFQQLSKIFSGENNQLLCRELLIKEGTAKFADMGESLSKSAQKKNQFRRKSYAEIGVTYGTVPYLGTFLTDLTMIDTAIPDFTEEGLVNFDKKRKEFEVLAQIKLLQAAAISYQIIPEDAFWAWFESVRVYDDNESHDLSCTIEPPMTSTPTVVRRHRKKPSFSFFPRRFSVENLLSDPSVSSDDRSSLSSFESPFSKKQPPSRSMSSSTLSLASMESFSQGSTSPYKTADFYIIKVRLATEQNHHTNVYKSIKLSNSEHTSTVISTVLEKYNIENGRAEDYTLAQLLPGNRELPIPDKTNVYYAMSEAPDLQFVVRRRLEANPPKVSRRKHRTRKFRKGMSYNSTM